MLHTQVLLFQTRILMLLLSYISQFKSVTTGEGKLWYIVLSKIGRGLLGDAPYSRSCGFRQEYFQIF